jgi:hypothetical protein
VRFFPVARAASPHHHRVVLEAEQEKSALPRGPILGQQEPSLVLVHPSVSDVRKAFVQPSPMGGHSM